MSVSREHFLLMKNLPRIKGTIVTGSMLPLIKIGDEINVEVGVKDLQRFDIIVFHSTDKLICHYVWQMNRIVKPLLIQTRSLEGGKDHPISWDDYLGKVTNFKLGPWHRFKILLNLKF